MFLVMSTKDYMKKAAVVSVVKLNTLSEKTTQFIQSEKMQDIIQSISKPFTFGEQQQQQQHTSTPRVDNPPTTTTTTTTTTTSSFEKRNLDPIYDSINENLEINTEINQHQQLKKMMIQKQNQRSLFEEPPYPHPPTPTPAHTPTTLYPASPSGVDQGTQTLVGEIEIQEL